MKNSINAGGVRFLLKDARATGPTLISLAYRYKGERFVYSTGQYVEPYQWDADTQRARTTQKNRAERDAHQTINAHLDGHRAALLRVVATLQLAGAALTNERLKTHLDTELGKDKPAPKPKRNKETFTDFITRFVAEGRAGERLNAKNTRFADGTLVNFLKFRNILIDYQRTTGRALAYADYTLDFYGAFKRHLSASGLSLNYVGAVLNGVKMLLGYAYREGLHKNTDYQQKEFRKIEEDAENIYLTDDELSTLYALDLGDDARLDRVRDLFLIGCYTGLRFSDYSQLRPQNIVYGGQILQVTTQKTGAKVSIPLNPNVAAILAKYDGGHPRPLSNQKFNEYLKELGQRAGFTAPVERTRTQGGKRAVWRAEKWEMITSHTARRSFATNAFLAGVPTVAIMKITGHKSETQFLKYIKVTGEENARLLLQHPHFTGRAPAPAALVRPLHKVA